MQPKGTLTIRDQLRDHQMLQLGYSKYLRKCNWETFGSDILQIETMLDFTVFSASNDLN